VGVAPAQSPDLQSATNDFVNSVAQSNPQMRPEGNPQPVTFAGRQALQLRLRNVSEATGSPEVVLLTTAMLDNSNLLYSVGVAPESEFSRYNQTLQKVNQSVQVNR
jgi:hypothetical protein